MTTYKTINGWTKEKMKERIRERVPTYGARSNEGGCVYRTNTGKSCAVGAFIPDDIYSSDMDDSVATVSELLDDYPELDKIFPVAIQGLEKMQDLHDIEACNNKSVIEPLCDWIDNNVVDV